MEVQLISSLAIGFSLGVVFMMAVMRYKSNRMIKDIPFHDMDQVNNSNNEEYLDIPIDSVVPDAEDSKLMGFVNRIHQFRSKNPFYEEDEFLMPSKMKSFTDEENTNRRAY